MVETYTDTGNAEEAGLWAVIPIKLIRTLQRVEHAEHTGKEPVVTTILIYCFNITAYLAESLLLQQCATGLAIPTPDPRNAWVYGIIASTHDVLAPVEARGATVATLPLRREESSVKARLSI